MITRNVLLMWLPAEHKSSHQGGKIAAQTHTAQAVNQEQLALYFGIGRYVTSNTRNKNWGQGVLEQISERLRQE